MRKMLAVILLGLGLLATLPARGEVGDVVSWYWGRDPHWYGGLTIKQEGGRTYICENESATGYIWIMQPNATNPHELDTVGSVELGIAKDAGIAWDPDHDYWWVSGANWYFGIGKLPANGGSFLVSWIPPYVNPYGIDYYSDSDEHKLYVGTSYGTKYLVYDCSGDVSGDKIPPLEKTVDVGFIPIAIARAGDNIWVSDANAPFGTYKFDLNGNYLEEYFLLPSDEGGVRESLSLSFDGQYLWSRSNDNGYGIKIFQIDIGFVAASPTPTRSPATTPSPTPPPSATPSPLITPPLVPLPDSGDYDGDGTSEIAVFRPGQALWKIRGMTSIYFGSVEALPVPGDYDGSGTTDLATFLPSSGLWRVRNLTSFYLGGSSDWPVPGDYDGDGRCDPAIFGLDDSRWNIRGITRFYLGEAGDRPVPGYYTSPRIKLAGVYRPDWGKWSIRGETEFFFGEPGDIPLPLRTAEGIDIPAFFRPETALWKVRGVTSAYCGRGGEAPAPLNAAGEAEAQPAVFDRSSGLWRIQDGGTFYFGRAGDYPAGGTSIPFNPLQGMFESGDFSGNGTTDLAVYDPGDGQWVIRGLTRFILGGGNGIIPLAGDIDGDGRCEAGIFRRPQKLWEFPGVSSFYFGAENDVPYLKDYDGDGTADPGYWRPEAGLWNIRGITRFYFGRQGDRVFAGKFLALGREDGVGYFRPSEGLWNIRGMTRFYFGGEGDTPLVFDVDGWGLDEIGIFRHRDCRWVVRNLTGFVFGKPGDYPLARGRFSGQDWAEPAVYRESNGLWKIDPEAPRREYLGGIGEIPISGR